MTIGRAIFGHNKINGLRHIKTIKGFIIYKRVIPKVMEQLFELANVQFSQKAFLPHLGNVPPFDEWAVDTPGIGTTPRTPGHHPPPAPLSAARPHCCPRDGRNVARQWDTKGSRSQAARPARHARPLRRQQAQHPSKGRSTANITPLPQQSYLPTSRVCPPTPLSLLDG